MDRLRPASTVLVLVDVQERLAAAMEPAAYGQVLANGALLLDAARILSVPVLATEQYPKGLGPTVAALGDKLRAQGVTPFPKTTFDACGEPAFSRALSALSPRAAVVMGMEAHVCVFQTARELSRRGMTVHVVGDAVASRKGESRATGLGLCERAGAVVTTAETVVFDWMERAGTAEFKAIAPLLK